MITIIPARGGSKGIPRKNLHILDGKPLLCHIADKVPNPVVSTEDPEIRAVALNHGYQVVDRPPHLAADNVPVADVARHACQTLDYHGPLIVAQPTCPHVTPETLQTLISRLDDHHAVTVVTPNPHILRNNKKRLLTAVNRQWLQGVWQEVGVRAYATPDDLFREPSGTVEVAGREGLDIDTYADIETAKPVRTVLFQFTCNQQVGTGHMRRVESLAAALGRHHIEYQLYDSDPWVGERFPTREIDWPPTDLVVVDRLDTTVEEVAQLKADGSKVVTIEDRGPGARHADIVINALYPQGDLAHELSGPEWADLRPEFVGLPEYEIRDTGRILLLFGGTDPAGLGERFSRLFPAATWIRPGDDVSVSHEMMTHDVLVTSAGRTVYEADAVGIPTVVVAQNYRETTHAHLGVGNLFVGLGQVVSDGEVSRTVNMVLRDAKLRQELSSHRVTDGKGLGRIVHVMTGLLEDM